MARKSSDDSARQTFVEFLDLHHINDEAVIEYIVEAATTASVDVELLDDLLCGFSSESWAAYTVDERLCKLSDLMRQVAMCQNDAAAAAVKPELCVVPQRQQSKRGTEQQGTKITHDSGSSIPGATGTVMNARCKPATKQVVNVPSSIGRATATARQGRLRSTADALAVDASASHTALRPSEKDRMRAAIDAFLMRHGGPPLHEEAVAEYVHSMLADIEGSGDGNAAGAAEQLEQLDELLCGFDPDCWGDAPEAPRHMRLCDLLCDISSLQRQEAQMQQPQPLPPLVEPAAARTLPAAAAGRREQGVAKQADATEDSIEQPSLDPGAVATLQEISGGNVSPEYLAHILQQRCGGDLESAAQHLVECPDLADQERSWRAACTRALADAKQEAEQRKAARQRIFARFDLEAVSTTDGTSRRKNRQAAVEAWQPADGQKAGAKAQVRYRDGRLVSTRGEKYVFEKVDEYDGGSRGRVKTKGKRGVGYA